MLGAYEGGGEIDFEALEQPLPSLGEVIGSSGGRPEFHALGPSLPSLQTVLHAPPPPPGALPIGFAPPGAARTTPAEPSDIVVTRASSQGRRRER